jgi:hypothetical protein
MRTAKLPQMQSGQTDIADITIDVTSRDDIPMILLGLQHIYTTLPLKNAVFKILEEVIPHKEANDSANLVAVVANKGPRRNRSKRLTLLARLCAFLNSQSFSSNQTPSVHCEPTFGLQRQHYLC